MAQVKRLIYPLTCTVNFYNTLALPRPCARYFCAIKCHVCHKNQELFQKLQPVGYVYNIRKAHMFFFHLAC